MKKIIKKNIPLLLVITMLLTIITPVSAANTPLEKEEVIYANLNADGTVKDIYAVNIFGNGDITDFGDYSSVEILNTTDKITQDGDKITFTSSSDRIYCKGKLKNRDIPWNISLRYFIDKTEYSAEDAAEKSGKLEVYLEITENENYQGSFYDNYALQISFTLDTEKCRNISAPDSTLANVGSQKQISYTVLPGRGLNAVIEADVTDFEMSAVSINGIPLSINIEIDDAELLDRVNELTDAIVSLDDGAGDLNDGGIALSSGTDALKNGASALYDGACELQSGTALIQNGLDELNKKSADLTNGSASIQHALIEIQKGLGNTNTDASQIAALVDGSSQIKSAIDSIYAGIDELQKKAGFATYKSVMLQNGLDIDELQSKNTQTIAELKSQIDAINIQLEALNSQIADLVNSGADQEQIAPLLESAAQLSATVSQLENIMLLLQGNHAAINGTDLYLTKVNQNIAVLKESMFSLKESYEILDSSINTLAGELESLMVNMSALKTGVDTLVTEYGKLDSGISEYTGGVAQIVAGYSQLTLGTESLLSGSSELKSKTAELSDKTAELANGLSDLKDGTSQMRDETSGIDDEISDKIDEMIKDITGDGEEIHSFVSDKNTNVTSVQFVIQTEAIEIKEPETPEPETQKKLTLWQKIMNLFK